MKIGVDYFSLSYATGGIKRFITEFLNHVPSDDKKNEYELVDFKNAAHKIYQAKDIKVRNVQSISPRLYRAMTTFLNWPPIDTFSGEKDVFIFLNFIAYPVSSKTKKIVFIYDAGFLKYPQYVSERTRFLLKKMVPRSLKSSDIVITISESVKKELIKEYGVEADKVKVVYMGVDDKFKQSNDLNKIEEIKHRYGITKNYFLYVSTIEPRKNVQGIIAAYNSLPEKTRRENQLVLIGGKGWLDEEIHKSIDLSPEKKNIILPGFVEDEDLSYLYSGALAFLYPSFYEGFGIPILEAMACGTPVITSNTSSMPEIAGDAALYVSPDKVETISTAMAKMITSSTLREELSLKGLHRVKSFSWEKTFSKLIDIINSVKKEK